MTVRLYFITIIGIIDIIIQRLLIVNTFLVLERTKFSRGCRWLELRMFVLSPSQQYSVRFLSIRVLSAFCHLPYLKAPGNICGQIHALQFRLLLAFLRLYEMIPSGSEIYTFRMAVDRHALPPCKTNYRDA